MRKTLDLRIKPLTRVATGIKARALEINIWFTVQCLVAPLRWQQPHWICQVIQGGCMRKLLIVAGAFLIGLAPAAVSAKLFDYSISFAQSNDLSTIYRAAGRLDATLVGAWGPGNVNELFQVNSASGFVTNNYNSNSATIDGVEPFSGSYPQFTFFKGSFDNAGLALTTLDGGSFYVFNSGGGPSAAYVEAFGNAYGSITAVVVPEPAAWAMMLIGFGFAGAALRARRAGPSAVRA